MPQPQIPNYEIKEKISKGSLATVYRAIHIPLHREVALKILSIKESSFDKSSQKRFLSEARISANLEHPNIINIYDTGRHKDYCYFSMEYLNQGSLRLKLSANENFTTEHHPANSYSPELHSFKRVHSSRYKA